MERIISKNIREKKRKKAKNKRKKIIITILIIAIIAILLFVANKFIPVKDISKDDIKISISTSKLTGDSVTATISSSKLYDIYYYIDYVDEETENLEESDYYAESLTDTESNTVSNTTSSVANNVVSNSTTTASNTTSNIVNTTNSSNNVANNSVSNNSTNSVNNTVDSTETKKTLATEEFKDSDYTKINGDNIVIENNATVYLKYGRFGKLSSTPYTFEIDNIDKTGPEIGEIQVSTTDSTVTVTVTAIDLLSDNLTYYFKLQDDKDYTCTDSNNTYTFTNLEENTDYTIFIKVEDEFGNSSEAVTDTTSEEEEVAEKKTYYIKVNLATNIVVIYDKDENGKYEKPVKEFLCSTGTATPKSGTYQISYRYRWLALFGNVYGQYAVRIHGNILFHSVPYTEMYPDTLEYEEYDKLGTSASAGCIRLTVKDVKWIYDNVASGSSVTFYSDASDNGPLTRPTAQKISSNTANRNWDPTDPDSRNPWNGGTGVVSKVEKKVNSATNTTTNTTNTTNTVSNNTISNNTTNSIKNNTVSNNTVTSTNTTVTTNTTAPINTTSSDTTTSTNTTVPNDTTSSDTTNSTTTTEPDNSASNNTTDSTNTAVPDNTTSNDTTDSTDITEPNNTNSNGSEKPDDTDDSTADATN